MAVSTAGSSERALSLRTVVRGGLTYFLLVFACGFALGTVRTLLLVPGLGTRTAELLEIPVMIAISYVAAQWVVRRFHLAAQPRSAALLLGVLALVLLVGAELLLVLPVRGISLLEYWRERDPIAFAAYLVSLVVFGILPWLVRFRVVARCARGTPKSTEPRPPSAEV